VKRLTELLESARSRPLRDAVDAVDTALLSWRAADHFEDDVTLLIIERE
jgi:serine phosphatase RsbU (regulator of sigma subunit)